MRYRGNALASCGTGPHLLLDLLPVPSGMLTRRSVSVHYDGLPGMKDEILHDEVYE